MYFVIVTEPSVSNVLCNKLIFFKEFVYNITYIFERDHILIMYFELKNQHEFNSLKYVLLFVILYLLIKI